MWIDVSFLLIYWACANWITCPPDCAAHLATSMPRAVPSIWLTSFSVSWELAMHVWSLSLFIRMLVQISLLISDRLSSSDFWAELLLVVALSVFLAAALQCFFIKSSSFLTSCSQSCRTFRTLPETSSTSLLRSFSLNPMLVPMLLTLLTATLMSSGDLLFITCSRLGAEKIR